MAGRLLVSNGMQWLLTRVFRARELHRKSGLKATLGLGLKKLISPVARVGSVYLMASVSNQRNYNRPGDDIRGKYRQSESRQKVPQENRPDLVHLYAGRPHARFLVAECEDAASGACFANQPFQRTTSLRLIPARMLEPTI